MALNFPLNLAQFFDPLPVGNITFKPSDNRTFTETGAGEIIPAARGVRLWGGQVSIDIETHAQIARFESKLSLLEEPGASFLIYDRRKPFPSADPGGLIIAGSTPVIAALDPNNRELDLSGLPAGYVLSDGDLIGWTYGSGPVRYALHRIAIGAIANGSGIASNIEVTPKIRPGAAISTPVNLVKPLCKAVIDTANYGAGRSVITQGGSFDWKQTLR